MFQHSFLAAKHRKGRSKYYYSQILSISRQSLDVLTMDQFISTLPEGKSVTCLEDLSAFSVKELKNILVSYREKSSGAKADLVLRVYALFCKVKDPTNSSSAISNDDSSLELSSNA